MNKSFIVIQNEISLLTDSLSTEVMWNIFDFQAFYTKSYITTCFFDINDQTKFYYVI